MKSISTIYRRAMQSTDVPVWVFPAAGVGVMVAPIITAACLIFIPFIRPLPAAK